MIAILIDLGLIIAFVLAAILLVVAWFIKGRNKATAITVILIVAAGIIAQLYLMVFNLFFIETEDRLPTGQHSLVGVVDESKGTVYGTTTLQLKITDSETLPVGRMISIADAPTDIKPGQEIACDIILSSTEVDNINLYIDGVFLSAIYDDNIIIMSEGNGIFYFFSKLQAMLTDRITPYLSESISGIAAAITYGDRTGLPYEIQLDFRSAGLSHVLVVSGLHLSILCGIILTVLRKITPNRFILYPVLILIVIFYTLLCGVRLSIVRAAFVVIMLSISKLLSKRADSYTSLGFAVLVVTLLNPYSAVDLSLLLSLFATVGILFGNELWNPINNKLNKLNRYVAAVIKAAITSAAAILATMPVFAAIGDGFSLLAIPANLLVVALSTPIIGLTLVAILTTFIPVPQLSAIVFKVVEILIELLVSTAKFVANIEWQFIHFIGDYPFIVLLVAFVVGFILLLFDKKQNIPLAGSIIILVSILTFYLFDYNTLHVAIVGETQNPVVVITQNSTAAVIYRGSKGNNDEVERYLSGNNIRKIDTIVDISSGQSSLSLVAESRYSFDENNYYNDVLTVLDNVELTIRKQSDSNIALIDVAGFNIG